MVCIDEVVAYFKTLKSYERLWMMCRLQSHCLPIELRYLGTCLDNLSKRDIHILKKLELEANDPASVSEVACKCICDKTVRAAVIKYLSVLNTNSTKCSELIYKALTDDKGLERIFKCPKAFFNDKNAFEELMVLYTLAVNHPAFIFEQKTQLDSIFNCIKKEKERQLSKKKGDLDKESSDILENINTMIPPPNYMYQQTQGGSNYPLNRNGYLYPRHYYPFPPVNVPPMQVCYDFPPPTAVSGIRGPHQANFSKSPSPVSWPPRTFQINPRNQPPNINSKQRHPTPPRYRNPSDPSYPFSQSWNNWNMYQMSPHNVYTNYNYTPGMVPSFYPENPMGRNYQGHGTKTKHSTVNRHQDQCKSQIPPPVPVSTSPNNIDTVVKNKPLITNATINSTNESEPILETHNQMPSSSKSSEDCSQSSSYKSINSSISDKVSGASPQHAVQGSSNNASPKLVQSENQCQNGSAQVCNLKLTFENKIKTDNDVQTISTTQPTLPKTYSPPINSQQTLCTTDTKQQTTATLGLPKNESTKNIDLSTLSSVLDDGKNTEEKSIVVSNELTEEKLKSNSHHKPQNTKIPLQLETNTTKVYEVKEPTVGASAKPINTSITTSSYNAQTSKYYKGRPIQSQPRTSRDGNINNSYNRKSMTGGLAVSSFNETGRENIHKTHLKVPNNGQQYYTMAYDNGATARGYNTQAYYVHQPQTSQSMSGFSPMPRQYIPQQHVIQSPEYQQVYQQPTEFVYYPSSSQTFYTTTPVLMQPQVLAYHPPKVSCYNCGGQNHTGAECTELTMEEITSKGLYEHHYGPSMPDGRPRN
ncbi:hypothetical protein AGLY_001785 [Aphis glycines]|uniref:CCHC-type domain-containing protein n=1 Tax=Aphis glycines TaxID=307491 RepID=A0A6G0U796_APHGL|nr:hypothetical protein AGLY_001785 [Aphis glycines]